MFLQSFDSGRELLKWIAIITMTADHVGEILYPELEILRLIGRLSFPLFAYLLMLGMETTRNIRNYLIRLFVFAFISQVPFFLATDSGPFDSLNIFFTLSAGLLFIYFFKKSSIIVVFPLIASLVLPFDYGIYGIAVIGCMHILKTNTTFGVASLVLLNSLFLVPWNSQFLSIAAIPLIVLHKNGSLTTTKETGEDYTIPVWRKYFFYIYYPLHLTLLYIIKLYYF
ncbi:MAG: TraX family protein [Candidatus Bathyarchaeota archaeon]